MKPESCIDLLMAVRRSSRDARLRRYDYDDFIESVDIQYEFGARPV